MKRLLFSTAVLSSFVPINVLSKETQEGTKVICDKNGNKLNTLIEDINYLINKRNYLYMNNDMNKVLNLENNFNDLEIKEKSVYELSRDLVGRSIWKLISNVYVSQRIKSIPLTGIEGKTVRNISLLCPYSTSSIN